MFTTGKVGVTLLLVGAVALAVSLVQLTENLRNRNVTTMRLFGDIDAHEFSYLGHEGSVYRVPAWDDPDPDPELAANPVLRLTWRGQTLDFPMGETDSALRDEIGLGLEQYRQWFAVMILIDGAESREDFEERWRSGDIEPRLVAAARYFAPGVEGAWQMVRRTEWEYIVAELKFDGPDEEAIDWHAKSYRELDAIYLPSIYTPEEMIPTPEERERDLWQYFAMIEVTPTAQYRGRNKTIEPVIREMGLAWPAAGTSVLAMVVGVLMIGMSVRGRTPA